MVDSFLDMIGTPTLCAGFCDFVEIGQSTDLGCPTWAAQVEFHTSSDVGSRHPPLYQYVPHKAVPEVSKIIANYRRGLLL